MREWQLDADVVHRRRWLSLVMLCISLIVVIIDNSILNVALPTLGKPVARGGLGAADSDLQWIVDSYVLVFAGLLITFGALGDRFGRYRALAIGLLVFGTGSALASMSDTAGQLIAYRALMGIGAAAIMPATLSIITNVFRDPRERGRAIGVWAGISGIGLAIGPVTGGFLLEHFWWGSVLLVNVPVVIIGLVGGFFLIPDSRDPSAPRVDVPGALLSIAGLTTVLWALIEGPTKGWRSGSVLGAFGLGFLIIGAFLAWERHTDHPMLDLDFFRRRRFSVASGAITFTFMALMGTIFGLTQYQQSVLDYTPLRAGANLIPMSAVMVVLAPLSARWVERLGTKLVLGAGLLVVSFSLVLFSLFTVDTASWQLIVATMVMGAGMAHIMAPATESIMGSLPREKAGVGSAVNDTTRQMGGAIGVALLGSLLATSYGDHVDKGLSGSGLSSRAVNTIGTTIQKGIDVGAHTDGPLGGQIIDVVRQSYVSGLHLAVLVGAAVLALAAAGVFAWLPARAAAPAAAPTAAPEPEPAAADELEPAFATD